MSAVKTVKYKSFTFEQLCQLLIKLGFDDRIRSSYHTYTKDSIEEILNILSTQRKAKVYQIKQVHVERDLISLHTCVNVAYRRYSQPCDHNNQRSLLKMCRVR